MLKEERQNLILNQLQEKKKVLSSEICEQYGVSEDTIRRDLKELASQGRILKVHGGALVTSQNVFSYREEEIFDHDKKKLIGEKAIRLIKSNDVVILGGGTTILQLVNVLPPDLHATVYTYSLPVAMRLADHPLIETLLFGGKIMKKPRITIDLDMLQKINDIRADICFLGASGISVDSGLMEIDLEVAQLKKAIANVSDRVVILSTIEKIDTKQRFLVCGMDSISTLITEVDPNSKNLTGFKEKGLEII